MVSFFLKRCEYGVIFGEKPFFAQIHHKGNTGDFRFTFDGQFEKLRKEGDRHIINAIKARIFKGCHCGAFPGARKSGYNDDGKMLHFKSSIWIKILHPPL